MNTDLQTHYGLAPGSILTIGYDYQGPGGCQRKLVITTDMLYVYLQQNNAWVITENLAEVSE
jgi:hypothetical protein